MSCSRLACKITAAYGRVKGGDKKPLPQPFQTLYTGKWIMYNNGPVTASSFSFQKRTAVPIKEAVAAFLLYFQSPLAVFLDFNSFPNILHPFSITSLFTPAANPFDLYFFLTDLSVISNTLFDGLIIAAAVIRPVNSSTVYKTFSISVSGFTSFTRPYPWLIIARITSSSIPLSCSISIVFLQCSSGYNS